MSSPSKPLSLLASLAVLLLAMSQGGLHAQERLIPVEGIDPRRDTLLAWDSARQRVVAYGGVTATPVGSGGPVGSQTLEWDGQEWTRRRPLHSPPARTLGGLAYDAARAECVLFGGAGYRNDTWVWDGVDWTERLTATRPSGRVRHALAYDPIRRRTLLFGGLVQSGGALGTWEWDGSNWLQRTPALAPAVRSAHQMAFDPRSRRIVLFGGDDPAGNFLQETWSWDGVVWTRHAPLHQPSQGGPVLLATDEGRGRLLAVANQSALVLDPVLVHEWNGTDWIPVPIPSAKLGSLARLGLVWDGNRGTLLVPFGRDAAPTWAFDGTHWKLAHLAPRTALGAIVTDTRRNRAVLISPNSYHDQTETWEWDGYRWQPLLGSGVGLAQRVSFAACFDVLRGQTLIFGGITNSAPLVRHADLRAFDGQSWRTIDRGTGPSGRSGAAMDFEPASGTVILFGGTDANGYLDDTWRWNGLGWTRLNPRNRPAPRAGAAFTIDPVRGRGILTGGIPNSDRWEWTGTDWVPSGLVNPPPSPVTNAYSTWDPVRNAVVIGDVNGLWSYAGNTWSPITTDRIFSVTGLGFDPLRNRVLVKPSGIADTWLLTDSPSATSRFGAACASSAGTPELDADSLPVLGNPGFEIELARLPPAAPGLLLLSASTSTLTIGSCQVLAGILASLPLPAVSPQGQARVRFPIPFDPSLLGVPFSMQAFVVDVQGVGAAWFATSVGLRVAIGD